MFRRKNERNNQTLQGFIRMKKSQGELALGFDVAFRL